MPPKRVNSSWFGKGGVRPSPPPQQVGDRPRFVSMVNSAAQNLLSAKTISNKGQLEILNSFLCVLSYCALICAPPVLGKSLTTLNDAHALFSASNDRIACFSAQEWDNWFNAVTKVHFILHANVHISHLYSSCRLLTMRTFFNFPRP